MGSIARWLDSGKEQSWLLCGEALKDTLQWVMVERNRENQLMGG
jgi:hypothetical protein